MEELKLQNLSISAAESAETDDDGRVNLECLPLVIFEKILHYDDGDMSLVLRNTSQTLLDKVDVCLSKIVGWRHWRNICFFQIERDQLNKILASFDTLTARDMTQYKLRRNPIPLVDRRYFFSWEDVYKVYHDLYFNLEFGDAQIVRLKIETLIRDDILLCYSNGRERISYTYPMRMTRAFGTFFFNLNLPPGNRFHTDTMTVFEDMKDVKYTANIGCNLEVDSNVPIKLNVMMINNFKKPSANLSPPLPSVGRILIFSCAACVNLVPLQMGKSFKIPLEREPLLDEFDNEAEPIIAFNENDLIIWSSKNEIFHYAITQSPFNDVQACKLESWKFKDLEANWELFRDAPKNEYYPILRRVKNEKSAIDKLYNYNDEENEDKLILEFISPVQPKRIFDKSHGVKPGQLPQVQLASNQRFRLFGRDWIEREFSPLIGIRSENGCSIFWSRFAFAMTWNGRKWNHIEFNEILPKSSQIHYSTKLPSWKNTNPLPLVEIISLNLFMIGYRNEIFIYESKYVMTTENDIDGYGVFVSTKEVIGDIEYKILRSFKLPLVDKIEIITQLSFDFEVGHLYLFAISQVPKYRRGELFKYFKITIDALQLKDSNNLNIFKHYQEKSLFKKLKLKYNM